MWATRDEAVPGGGGGRIGDVDRARSSEKTWPRSPTGRAIERPHLEALEDTATEAQLLLRGPQRLGVWRRRWNSTTRAICEAGRGHFIRQKSGGKPRWTTSDGAFRRRWRREHASRPYTRTSCRGPERKVVAHEWKGM